MSKNTQDPNGSKISPKARAVLTELSDEFFERRDHILAILVGLFSGNNTYLLGDPGTGKSLLIRRLAERVVQGNYKELLLDRQLPMESLFGPLDIIDFRNTGKYHRATEGYLPWAHFIFLDEVGKAGPAVLNPLLTLLNEGIYHNNSVPMQCNILTAVGASNEELEEELAAMWDRWMLRLIVNPIQEPRNFSNLLLNGAARTANPTTLTLDEIVAARDTEVPNVTLPQGVVDSILNLRNTLRGKEIAPSDRRWRDSVAVLKATAWIDGRDTVDDDDLAILRHVLWDVVEQIPTVEREVLKLTSELTAKAVEYDAMVDEIEAEIDARKGQSTEKRAEYGAKAQTQVKEIGKKVEALLEEAHRKGRSTVKLDALTDRLRSTKTRIYVECLGIPSDRASLI